MKRVTGNRSRLEFNGAPPSCTHTYIREKSYGEKPEFVGWMLQELDQDGSIQVGGGEEEGENVISAARPSSVICTGRQRGR